MKLTRKWKTAAMLVVLALSLSSVALAQQQMEGVRGADAIEGIFGVDAETLASAIATARESSSILSTVAGVVNMAALFAAVFVVLLTFINAILQTGEHGKVGGRYSMVWVPLRVAIAAGFLTPLSLGGYSVVQAFVLWLGMIGSGFADQAWVRSNSYLSDRMALSDLVPPRASANVASKLYQMEACAAAVAKSATGDGSNGATSTFAIDTPAEFIETVVDKSTGLNRLNPLGVNDSREITMSLKYSGTGDLANVDTLCGAVTLKRTVPLGTVATVVTEQEVASLSMREQARAIVDIQGEVRALAQSRQDGTITAPDVRAELIRLEGVYLQRLERVTRRANYYKFAVESALRQAQMATAEANGWLVAGAYYMTFAAFDSRMNQQALTPPEFSDFRDGELPSSVLRDVRPQIVAAEQILPRSEDAAGIYVHPDHEGDWELTGAVSATMGAIGGMASPQKAISQAFDSLNRKMAGIARDGYVWIAEAALDDGSSLVPRIVEWGHLLLGIAAVAFTAVAAGSIVGGVLTGVGGFMIFGIGMSFVMPIFFVGATMAYVIPALPLLIWIAGVAGWLMMLVQAVVAAPLWAAAHASPEGEGFAGQRAMDGYMLLISLVARPVLMIAGLLAAMLLLDFLGGFVLKAFQIFSGASAGPGAAAPGLVGMAVWIFLTGAMLVVLTRWSFSLILVVPDSVLRFIGARTEAFGETNMAEQARTMAVGAWMATQRAVGGVSGAGSKLAGAGGKAAGGVSASRA